MKSLKKNKIYEMDVFDFLNSIESGSIDLAVVDPPYNMKKGYWDTFKSDSEYFDFTFISAIIDEFKSLNVVKYDYFNEQESKNFLLKYNLLYPERHCIFKLKAKRVTKLKEGKIYQDYLKYFFYTDEFPFYKLENQDLINIETHSVYPYVGKVKKMEFLEVTEEYQKDFLEYYLYS